MAHTIVPRHHQLPSATPSGALRRVYLAEADNLRDINHGRRRFFLDPRRKSGRLLGKGAFARVEEK